MRTHIWIDDLRDPKDYLPKEKLDNVLWLKKIREAIKYVHENSSEIEELYLDHYMDDHYLFGDEFVFMAAYDRERGKGFEKLKKIHLHSDDDDEIDELMSMKSRFDRLGIVLEKATYRKN